MELFKIGGFCPETNYVFMGEFSSPRRAPFILSLDLDRLRSATAAVNDDTTLTRRRLCRPRLLLCRDIPTPFAPQSAIPRPDHPHPRQPRVTADHASVWVLRRVPAQIRKQQRVEVLLRGVRLLELGRGGGWTGVLCTWWTESAGRAAGPSESGWTFCARLHLAQRKGRRCSGADCRYA
jgi:hypothetical protein